MRPIATQVVVVTGASSGIGRATALAFARRGARLVLVARDPLPLADTERQVVAAGARALAVPADVTIADDLQQLANTAISCFGRIDTWVNAAGIAPRGRLDEAGRDVLEQALLVNLFGVAESIRVALPIMREQGGGVIIAVGSLTAIRGAPGRAAYSASKHALKGYIEAARVELARDAPVVRLTLIQPGAVSDAPAAARHRFASRRFPPHSPDAVAGAIVFAAEHPRRDIYVGAGRLLAVVEGIAPSLLDWLYLRASGSAAQSHPVESASDPIEMRAMSHFNQLIEFHPRRAGLVVAAVLGLLPALVRVMRRWSRRFGDSLR
jgi:NADP-dependent 3-hydroxy acid dehydrogenase YdfG